MYFTTKNVYRTTKNVYRTTENVSYNERNVSNALCKHSKNYFVFHVWFLIFVQLFKLISKKMDTNIVPRRIHHGSNIKRLRDIVGVKQEEIAQELGWTQQAVSKLEQKEQIDDETLKKVAKVLHISVEAIKNFNEEATMTFITNTFNYHKTSEITNFGSMCTINPIEKIMEFYESLLKTEREKVALLEKRLKK